jgi:hypothetical protein
VSGFANQIQPLPVLWVDGVGGYLLVDRPQCWLGRSLPPGDRDCSGEVGLRIFSDISRRAVQLRRIEHDWLLIPNQACWLAGQPLERPQLIGCGDRFRIGQQVQLGVSRPHPLSSTLRLDLLSSHRWQPAVDGVLLVGSSCVLGPTDSAHVRCPELAGELVLFLREGKWWAKSALPCRRPSIRPGESFQVPIGERLLGDDWSLTLQPGSGSSVVAWGG